MRTFNLIRLGLAVVVLAAVGVGVAWNFFNGDGEITVAAPLDGSLDVTLDGQSQGTLSAGQHKTFSVKQGKHALDLGGTRAEVDVKSGFFHQLVPAKGECFVRFDVTNQYGSKGGKEEVENRFFDGQPFDVNSSDYWSESSLPSSIDEGNHVYLLSQVPCEAKAENDADLVADQFGE